MGFAARWAKELQVLELKKLTRHKLIETTLLDYAVSTIDEDAEQLRLRMNQARKLSTTTGVE